MSDTVYMVDYAHAVLSGEIVACKKIKMVYKRLLDAYEHPGRYHYDAVLGNRPIEFIERFCRQSQGRIGQPITLQPFQKAALNAASMA